MFNYKKISKELEQVWLLERRADIKNNIWDGVFPVEKTIKKYFHIYICTTVMNRLNDIEKYYIKNIQDNINYVKVHFLLLDYNSKDGLEEWAKIHLRKYIDLGIVNYYRTEEPQYYSMTHSRNIAFRLAGYDIGFGDNIIVLNVDADNLTNEGFVKYVNELANIQLNNGFFAKSKQILRGRLGFYRHEFINMLGGYDEDLLGYGHDDMDLMNRALELGLKMMWYGGKYAPKVEGHKKRGDLSNYKEERWWFTEGHNRLLSYTKLILGKFKANENRKWGSTIVTKNFGTEKIDTWTLQKI